jgi:hypothetical protein
MSCSGDATITFTAGRYEGERMTWQETTNAPTATISLDLFRVIFDAVGDETIDTRGDIDPGVLLGIVGLGPCDAEEPSAWVRLVCRWARHRSLRVRFDAPR